MTTASRARSPRMPVMLALAAALALVLLLLGLTSWLDQRREAAAGAARETIEQALWLRGEVHALASAELRWLDAGDSAALQRALRNGGETRRAGERLLQASGADESQQAHARQLTGQVDEALRIAEDYLARGTRGSLGPPSARTEARIGRLTDRVDSLVNALHAGAVAQLGSQARRATLPWFGLLLLCGLLLLALLCAVQLLEMRSRARAESDQGRLAGLAEQAQRRAERNALDLQRLAEIGDQLRPTRNIEEIAEVLGVAMQNLLPQMNGALYLQAPSRNVLRRQVGWGKPQPPLEDLFTPDDCWAMRRGVSYPTEAHAPPCRHLAPGTDPAHVLCVPLVAQGEAIGTLHFSGQLPPSLQERRLAQSIADLLALSVSQLRLQESMRVQSVRDPTTTLFNRRYLDASLLRECLRARRAQQTLALLLIDLDDFKSFNEKHSHEAGDAALAQLGAVIGQTVRPEDIAGRHGGEEFLILLPEADLSLARDRAELLRRAIRATPIDLHGRRVEPITCSIGLAIYPLHGSEPGLCLRAADKAVRQAKAAGRDRVEIAEEPTVTMPRPATRG